MTLRFLRIPASSPLNPAIGKEKFLGFVVGRRFLSEDAAISPYPSIPDEQRFNAGSDYRVNTSSGKNANKCWPWERFVDITSSKEISHSFSRQGDHGLLSVKQLELAVSQEDDFAELDFPAGDEFSKNPELSRKLLENESAMAKGAASSVHSMYKKDSGMKPLPKPQNCTPSSRLSLGNHRGFARMDFGSDRGSPINDTSLSQKVSRNGIIVDKVRPSITLQQLKEAVTKFGEILTSFMRTGDNGLSIGHIEFKSFESKTRAISAGCISVESQLLPICDAPISFCAAVRIYNINIETPEPTIHSVCMQCAHVRSLVRSSECTVDAHFSIRDNTAVPDILMKLNSVKMDGCQWLARLLENDALSPEKLVDASWRIEAQIGSLILDIRKQMQLKRIYLEDLEELHHAIVHLTDCPSINE